MTFWPKLGVTMTAKPLKTEVVSRYFFIVVMVSIDLPKISIKANKSNN